jgi:hypothetical protein
MGQLELSCIFVILNFMLGHLILARPFHLGTFILGAMPLIPAQPALEVN